MLPIIDEPWDGRSIEHDTLRHRDTEKSISVSSVPHPSTRLVAPRARSKGGVSYSVGRARYFLRIMLSMLQIPAPLVAM